MFLSLDGTGNEHQIKKQIKAHFSDILDNKLKPEIFKKFQKNNMSVAVSSIDPIDLVYLNNFRIVCKIGKDFFEQIELLVHSNDSSFRIQPIVQPCKYISTPLSR